MGKPGSGSEQILVVRAGSLHRFPSLGWTYSFSAGTSLQNNWHRFLVFMFPSRCLTKAGKLARLSSPMVESFRDALLKKGSRAMARKVLGSLKSILGEAQRRGLVSQNAASPVKVSPAAAGPERALG